MRANLLAICADVRAKGLPAVLHYTEQLDQVRLEASQLRVRDQELAEAHAAADPAFLSSLLELVELAVFFLNIN